MKLFFIIFGVLEVLAIGYAAWYHLKGKDSPK